MLKDFLIKFLTYGAGNVLQKALSLVLLPLYLRFFAPDEYGVIAVLTVVMSLLTLFTSAGVVNGLIRLYYEAQGDGRRALAGTTWLWYLLVAGGGGSILVFLAPSFSRLLFRTGEYAGPMRVLGWFFFFSVLQTVPFYLLRLEKKAGLYVGFSLFSFLTDFALKLYLIVSLRMGIQGYFVSSAIAAMVTFGVMTPFVVGYVKVSLDVSLLKQLLRLGLPYILSGLAMWTLEVSDRLLLTRFSGEAAVGIYALANNFANMFGVLLATPVALLLDPLFFAYAAERSLDETRGLLQRILAYAFIAGSILYLAIAVGSGDLVRVLTTYFGAREQYLEAVRFVPILTWAPFLYFLAIPSGLAALLIKKPEIASGACAIAASVNLGVNLFVIPAFGALGASITTVAAYLILVVVVYWRVAKVFPVAYDWRGLVRGLFCLAVAFALAWQIRLDRPVLSLFAKELAGVAVLVLLTLFVGDTLTHSERSRLFSYLRQGRGLVTTWIDRH